MKRILPRDSIPNEHEHPSTLLRVVSLSNHDHERWPPLGLRSGHIFASHIIARTGSP